MIGKIITMLLQFLDDTFKNMRCYSRCCEISECICSNTELAPVEDEVHHRQSQHQHIHEQALDTQLQHNKEND